MIYETLFTALGGSIVGGLLSLLGVYYSIRAASNEKQKVIIAAQKLQNISLLRSILAEVTSIKQILATQIETRLNDSQTAFCWTFPLDSDYLLIYRSNIDKIGLIPDPQLVQKIVALYTTSQLFIDCLKSNNQAWASWEEAQKLKLQYYGTPLEAYYQQQVERCECNFGVSLNENIRPAFFPLVSQIHELEKSIMIFLSHQEK